MNIIASIVIVASLFIPQGSEQQIDSSPLYKGEVAYVGNGGEAFLCIGNEGGEKINVADESALRGYAYEYLDRTSFVVIPITNLVRDASTDTLTFDDFETGVTNTFKFKFAITSGTRFDDVEFDLKIRMFVGDRTIPDRFIRKIVSNNEVTVIIEDVVDSGVKLVVSDFKVKQLKYGNPDYVNDLTKKVIKIHDSASEDPSLGVGDWPLGWWRWNLLHFYDGNRGEHWAKYAATNNVYMKNRQIAFGRNDKGLRQYAVGQSATDSNVVVTTVFGRDAVRVYQTDSTSTANHIRFGSIVPGNDVVTFTVVLSNEVFNASNLRLFASDRVASGDANWHEVAYTVASTNPITITTPRTNPNECYYMMSYGNAHVVVEIVDTLKANRLFVKDANGVWTNILDIASGGGGIPLAGHTYDFANGANFTKNLYTALTNVIQTLGGTVTNPPAFN